MTLLPAPADRSALVRALEDAAQNDAARLDPAAIEATLAPVLAADDPALTPQAYHLLGLALMTADLHERAIDVLGRAFRSGQLPAAALAAFPLGWLLADANRFDDAVAPLHMARRDPGQREAATIMLARVHVARGDVRSALAAAAVALQRSQSELVDAPHSSRPAKPDEWFQLALAFHEKGALLAAAACFGRCAETGDTTLAVTAANNAEALYRSRGNRGQAAAMRKLRGRLQSPPAS